jgi:hypothetical protein
MEWFLGGDLNLPHNKFSGRVVKQKRELIFFLDLHVLNKSISWFSEMILWIIGVGLFYRANNGVICFAINHLNNVILNKWKIVAHLAWEMLQKTLNKNVSYP